jgi:hypothetical protein
MGGNVYSFDAATRDDEDYPFATCGLFLDRLMRLQTLKEGGFLTGLEYRSLLEGVRLDINAISQAHDVDYSQAERIIREELGPPPPTAC